MKDLKEHMEVLEKRKAQIRMDIAEMNELADRLRERLAVFENNVQEDEPMQSWTARKRTLFRINLSFQLDQLFDTVISPSTESIPLMFHRLFPDQSRRSFFILYFFQSSSPFLSSVSPPISSPPNVPKSYCPSVSGARLSYFGKNTCWHGKDGRRRRWAVRWWAFAAHSDHPKLFP